MFIVFMSIFYFKDKILLPLLKAVRNDPSCRARYADYYGNIIFHINKRTVSLSSVNCCFKNNRKSFIAFVVFC